MDHWCECMIKLDKKAINDIYKSAIIHRDRVRTVGDELFLKSDKKIHVWTKNGWIAVIIGP